MSIRKIAKVLLLVIGVVALLVVAAFVYLRWSNLNMRTQDAAHQARWQLQPHIYAYDDVETDDVQHFLGPTRSIRSALRGRIGSAVLVTLVIRPDGSVADAWPTYGDPLVLHEAVALAKQWKFAPFKRDGKPVWVKLSSWAIRVYPPEHRPAPSVPFPEVRDWNSVKITLERSVCFGTCPAYRLEIRGNGSVTYDGKDYVVLEGVHRTKIPPDAVHRLVEKFRTAEFNRLYPKYAGGVTDNPTQLLSISIDGKVMRVVDYVGEDDGMPSAVVDLENEVDQVAGVRRWTRSDSQTIPSLKAEAWSFKSNSCENRALVAGVAAYGTLEVLNAVLAEGVYPDRPCAKPFHAQPGLESALAKAVERREPGMVDALLRAGAAEDQEGVRYAIVNAADLGDGRTLQVLLKHLKEPVTFTTGRGWTPLMFAAGSCVPDTVAILLRAGSDANAQNADGETALMSAASHSGARVFAHRRSDVHCDQTASLLLKAGANPWAVDGQGRSVLQRAKDASQNDAVRVLEAWMKAHPKK